MLLTACEKGLVDGVADVAPAGQAAKSVLQVRTRSGGSVGGEATVAYPVTVYVFSGEECRAAPYGGRPPHFRHFFIVVTMFRICGCKCSHKF